MTNYTTSTFLNKISGHSFNSENELVRYFETIAPAIFEIDKSRIVKELRATSNDGTLSNLADLAILDNFDRTQALVAFEFKLDRSITNYKGGSYEDAGNQLHKYCQLLKVPYGVLISDKLCEIYKYKYRGSIFSSEKIFCLPSLSEIEKQLNIEGNLTENSKETRYPKNNKLFARIFLLIVLTISYFVVNNRLYSSLVGCPTMKGIKGNVSLNIDGSVNEKIYHVYGSKFYDSIKLKSTDGDQCFRTEQQALNAGFRKSKGY